jgi:hypothetical protein
MPNAAQSERSSPPGAAGSVRIWCPYLIAFFGRVAQLGSVGPLNTMIKSQAIQWKATCWIVVGGLALLSVSFGIYMGRLFYLEHHPELWPRDSFGGPLWCGNTVTDPLGAMLSIGTPIGLAGVVGLVVLAYRGYASRTSAISAAGLALGCTTGLLVFGFRFFRHNLGGMHLSEIVWWLKPFGFFGV